MRTTITINQHDLERAALRLKPDRHMPSVPVQVLMRAMLDAMQEYIDDAVAEPDEYFDTSPFGRNVDRLLRDYEAEYYEKIEISRPNDDLPLDYAEAVSAGLVKVSMQVARQFGEKLSTRFGPKYEHQEVVDEGVITFYQDDYGGGTRVYLNDDIVLCSSNHRYEKGDWVWTAFSLGAKAMKRLQTPYAREKPLPF